MTRRLRIASARGISLLVRDDSVVLVPGGKPLGLESEVRVPIK